MTSISHRLGLPDPEECPGVVGLVVSLVGVTAGAALHTFTNADLAGFVVIVLALLVGWTSFLYTVVWGERHGAPD